FFQAEDGIRDGHVTGVQTCALPIYDLTHVAELAGRKDVNRGAEVRRDDCLASLRRMDDRRMENRVFGEQLVQTRWIAGPGNRVRSEERRVGKEGRGRWVRVDYRNNA